VKEAETIFDENVKMTTVALIQGGFIEERSLKQRGLIFSSRQNKYFSLFFN